MRHQHILLHLKPLRGEDGQKVHLFMTVSVLCNMFNIIHHSLVREA